MSELGQFAHVAHSGRIEDLVVRVQGWLLHPAHAHRYDVTVPEDAERQLQHRSGWEMLAEVQALDGRPLDEPRPPATRAFGNCRHFATLLTALLRERGVPARSRCGFGAYFEPNR